MPPKYLSACPADVELRAYLSDELDIATKASLEEHIESCGHCERRLGSLLDSQSFAIFTWSALPFSNSNLDLNSIKQPYTPRYECLGLIDVGGFGSVWKMLDSQFNRLVAVKTLKVRHAMDPSLIRRFFAEAQICSQLTHPFVVPIHDMGYLQDGRPYFAMKLVEGQQLDQAFPHQPQGQDSADWMTRVQAFGSICQAMAFAHDRNIIHRDLKPQNVMIGRHGEVQVMDWGLAKQILEPEQVDSKIDMVPTDDRPIADTVRSGLDDTQVGALGTYAYMAP
ncbi:MAG: protein kinase, partial [Planctomycetota bacterium]